MARYVDVDKLIAEYDRVHIGPPGGARKLMEEAPTADVVETKHGKWIDKENPRWRAYDIRHCSNCGWNIPKNNLRKKDLDWSFCPNCGARMDGGKI